MVISLSGKNISNNLLNLGGKILTENIEPFDVKQLKIQILNKIMIPLVNENWKYLEENSFMLNIILDKLNLYYVRFKIADLLLYKEFIKSIEVAINEHLILVELQKKMYNNCGNDTNFIFRTKTLKFKPEYELYHLVYGKPNKKNNENYNNDILKELFNLMKINNINFEKIKLLITNKYPKLN